MQTPQSRAQKGIQAPLIDAQTALSAYLSWLTHLR